MFIKSEEFFVEIAADCTYNGKRRLGKRKTGKLVHIWKTAASEAEAEIRTITITTVTTTIIITTGAGGTIATARW
jgi:hypothetical protein